MDLASTRARPRPRRPSLLQRLHDMLALRRHRRRLGDLDPWLLRDIGLTESEAREEGARGLWDVPGHWRR